MRWMVRALLALLALSAPASAQAPRRVALVIGNAIYEHAGRLANPQNDARLIARALGQAGFQTVETKSDLGYQAFGRALRDFREKAQGAQVALIYYAGHGIEENGKNWLIPTDAALASEYDLTFEAISLDQVMDALAGADLRVAILDACRDNPLGRSWTRGTRAVARGLAAVEADDVLVIYSAAPGMAAMDGTGGANSPFSIALARRLPERGLAIQLLGGRVRDDVLGATGNLQRPFVSASITGEPFYLVPGDARIAAVPPPAVRSLEGTWTGTVSWGPAGQSISWHFAADGSYVTTRSGPGANFDPGRWSQEGAAVRWVSRTNTVYAGRIEGDTISGTTTGPSGTFRISASAAPVQEVLSAPAPSPQTAVAADAGPFTGAARPVNRVLLCNHASVSLNVAIVYAPENADRWRHHGWRRFAPGECSELLATPAPYFLFRAEGGGRAYGSGAVDCVVYPGPFDVTLPAPGPGATCPRGMVAQPFNRRMIDHPGGTTPVNLGD